MLTHNDNRELLAELKDLRAALADPQTRPVNLAHRLGETEYKVERSGYQVRPAQAWFASVFVGINADSRVLEKARSVTLSLSPDVTLRLAEMDAVFGARVEGRPNPAFAYTYQYRATGQADRVVIFAYLRHSPSDPQSRIEQISIFHDA